MNITRIIAIAIIAGSFGFHASQAQTLKNAEPPAEFPPASYKGKQYVDSRGCIYIRAGIDGNVTWVPRVSRSRKQVCGYKPSQVAGSTAAPRSSGKQPELITVPGATAAAKPKTTTRTAPKPATTTVTTTYKPSTPPKTTRQPVPTVAGTATTKTTTTTTTTKKPVAAAAVPQSKPSGCSNASSLSQRYINNTSDVRCGPQREAPVTFGRGTGIGPQSSLSLTPNTRIVPAHVYENRQNTLIDSEAPQGYRTVWSDGRLNPHRAERGLQPAVLSQTVVVPAGFRLVDRDDDRLNPMRGIRTANGDAQTGLVWDNSIPRKLIPVDTSGAQRVTLKESDADSPAEAQPPAFLFATRSAPDAPAPPKVTTQKYVRVATYAADADARSVAQSLAGSGLPMRLGNLTRKGKTYRVVLAGPFTTQEAAQQALSSVRSSGYRNARLSK